MSIVSRCETLSEVMRHGFQRADEGDLNELVKLGFSIQWIKKIQDLPSRRRNQACDLLAGYLSNVLHQALGNHPHQEHFTAILNHVNLENHNEAEQDELVCAKASRNMMDSLYGMTNDEFRNRRKALGITECSRPHRVSPKQEEAIWKSWRRHADLPYPKRFLQVAQDTRLDLRTVWPVLRSALGLQITRRGKPANSPPRRAPRQHRRRPSDGGHDNGDHCDILYKGCCYVNAAANATVTVTPVMAL